MLLCCSSFLAIGSLYSCLPTAAGSTAGISFVFCLILEYVLMLLEVLPFLLFSSLALSGASASLVIATGDETALIEDFTCCSTISEDGRTRLCCFLEEAFEDTLTFLVSSLFSVRVDEDEEEY